MGKPQWGTQADQAAEQVLGYLNFSSGARDPQFLSKLDYLFSIQPRDESAAPPWELVQRMLRQKLESLASSSKAFQDAAQAEAVLDLAFDRCLREYRSFHADLLFHPTDRELFNAFFVGVVCEVVLRQGSPWSETERIVAGAISHLNDYVGYRPVATLANRRLEPYAHERLRPIPLYLRGAGVVHGPHQAIVELAMKLLRETDEDLLRVAQFDPDQLEELCYDPRAYDFDHPVNKRPNHHFGQWDPHAIDGKGNYTRFVVQQITLDALTSRLTSDPDIPPDELLFEAASVLAGTILMASGVSGSSPTAYDSNVTLTTLLPVIANFRDEFYARLFQRVEGAHAERLKREAMEKRQPFGGARQHLNSELARARASQLEHVHLAMIYGRMGYPEAAMRQANIVPVASARMVCQIDCAIDAVLQAIQAGKLDEAVAQMPRIRDLLIRGIECGAIIDPWNILGFDGNFSLFPAIENSVRDHRADDLVGLVEQIMAVASRLWSEAAAADREDLATEIRREFKDFAHWWRQFATHEVTSVDAVDSRVVFQAAEHVAQALRFWHQGGAASGDVAFWRRHTEIFDSPKACALVVDALLQRGDDVASMAILIHWLDQAEMIGLEEGDSSFHMLAENWMARQYQRVLKGEADAEEIVEINRQVRKMFDFLEANAGEYWNVPEFDLTDGEELESDDEDFPEEADTSTGIYDAAWTDVVYQDSTDDGQEGPIHEGHNLSHDELEEASAEIAERLEFIATLSVLWKLGAGIAAYRAWQLGCLQPSQSGEEEQRPHSDSSDTGGAGKVGAHDEFQLCRDRCEALTRWTESAATNRTELARLMEDVRNYPLPPSGGDHDSMVEYDRQRLTKESLLERIIMASVAYDDAIRWLLAAYEANRNAWHQAQSTRPADERQADLPAAPQVPGFGDENRRIVEAFAAALLRDPHRVAKGFPELLEALQKTALLYVPLAKGGNPHEIVSARGKQQALQELLVCLPKLGLLVQTRELLEAAREMERNNPVGTGAVTEFDELFKIGYTAMIESLVHSSSEWGEANAMTENGVKQFDGPSALFDSVERLTETMLVTWLAHSRTLRLSVLEKVSKKETWEKLVEFIQRYGEDLFTQRFFNLGNLRAILHQGADAWLTQLEEDPGDYDLLLLDDLGSRLPRKEAIEYLTLVLESIIENYSEYRDYNSTTTQSDQGELLYMLLDFLRLRTQYDRVAWHLKPVVWSHATLVRHGKKQAARLWRRALTERLDDEPQKYLDRLTKLQSKYAMRMPTVADRLSERFIQPLQIDRIKALVEPAMRDVHSQASRRVFELLEHEVELLTREPSGVGLDIPPWLASLEEEVEQVRHRLSELEIDPWALIDPMRQPFDLVRQQLDTMKTDANAGDD